MPESATLIMHIPPRLGLELPCGNCWSSTTFSTLRLNRPPCGIASRALRQRLSRTWCNCVGSPKIAQLVSGRESSSRMFSETCP